MQGRLLAPFVLGLIALAGAPSESAASCKLSKLAEFPVTMNGLQPLIHAQINGKDAMFIADSGAFYSMITPGSAAQYNLKLLPAPSYARIIGVGGRMQVSLARVKEFTIAGISIKDLEFMVGGSEVGGSTSVGLLGQNFFRLGDAEYDLAQGVIRLMRAEDCAHTRLAYWVKGDDPHSIMEIERATETSPHTMGVAYLNGAKIRVMFDSGADRSILSARAAARAGLKPGSPGVTEAGFSSGIGSEVEKTYLGTFSSFKIGEEEIRNARLRFGEIELETDMLLGADFFLSHRIYVASSQGMLYFTYNGGPVFNLSVAAAAPAAAVPPADTPPANTPAASASTAFSASAPGAAPAGGDLPDAAAYSRRGMAHAARNEYAEALADLTRACELSPDNADYHHQRGVVYQAGNQPGLALREFDRALEIRGDDLVTLVARAQLRFTQGDVAGSKADFALADRVAAQSADIRLFLAHGFTEVDDLQDALAQLNSWIAAHPADVKMGEALVGRCHAKGWLGQDLSHALGDCDQALKRSPGAPAVNARILGDRALVRLRLGDYAKSLADYDASLKMEPHNAWTLYGRGMARRQLNRRADGDADIAAAIVIDPQVADHYKQHGLVP
jgi:tetratricopeptide (TPR) repeat protein